MAVAGGIVGIRKVDTAKSRFMADVSVLSPCPGDNIMGVESRYLAEPVVKRQTGSICPP